MTSPPPSLDISALDDDVTKPEAILASIDEARTRSSEMQAASASNSTASWRPIAYKIPKEEPSIPCPAEGDIVVYCADVDAFVKTSKHKCMCRGGSAANAFAVIEWENDSLVFVMTKPECRVPLMLHLAVARPGFDSTSIWQAVDKSNAPWLVCVHFPVSGRKPIPESCEPYIVPCKYLGTLGETFVQAYPLSNLVTIESWRSSQEIVSPGIIYLLIEKIAHCLDEICRTGHSLLRISPDTILIEKQDIRFFGILSLDQPWNERCALAHKQIEYASIPPECLGFLRQTQTPEQSVYMLASILYYLISGNKVPACEAIGYDIAVLPRAFNPAFPIGWDEIVHRALMPNPEMRYPDAQSFLDALRHALDVMQRRRDYQAPVRYDVAVDTHIGITKRLRCPVNQDAVFTQSSRGGQRILMVVADGVSTSTYGSGDIASGMTVEKAREIWKDHLANAETINPAAEINRIFYSTNDAICRYIREQYADQSPLASECMGTTALVAIIDNGILTLGSIGDSRAYIIRDDAMSCITRDHNLFTVGIINGLPLEMCATHPHAGSLVQCLGYYEDAEEAENLAFDIFSMKLIPGDTLMLTTDGILDYVACDIAESEQKIAEVVRAARNSGLACLELIMQANMGGGGDNCGVGIVRVLAPNK